MQKLCLCLLLSGMGLNNGIWFQMMSDSVIVVPFVSDLCYIFQIIDKEIIDTFVLMHYNYTCPWNII